MDIWLDTTNIKTIQKALNFGLLTGITTNPDLIIASKKKFEDVLKGLLHFQEGPVAVQVIAKEASEMIQQGQSLYSYSNRIVVKIPLSKNGLEAVHSLSRQGIPTMATAIFTVRQMLMASLAGAEYIVPYIQSIEEKGNDPWLLLKQSIDYSQTYKLKTKILAASLRQIEHVLKCAEIGVQAITIKEELFEALIQDDEATNQRISEFENNWSKHQPNQPSAFI